MSRRTRGGSCARGSRAAVSSTRAARENASCACFEAAYGPAEPTATVPATETTLTTSDGAAASSAGRKARRHQIAAEVVRPRHLLDPLGRRRAGSRPARDPRVVDEQADLRMALADGGREPLDGLAVADVARLPLRAELLGERPQALLASAQPGRAASPSRRARGRSRPPMPLDAPVTTRHLRHSRTLTRRRRLAAVEAHSQASEGWCSAWPTAARSRGRSRAGSPPAARQLAFTYQGERIEKNVRDLAEPSGLAARHRVRRPLRRGRRARLRRGGERPSAAARPARPLGRVRGMPEDLEGRFTDTPRERFWLALDVSRLLARRLRARRPSR